MRTVFEAVGCLKSKTSAIATPIRNCMLQHMEISQLLEYQCAQLVQLLMNAYVPYVVVHVCAFHEVMTNISSLFRYFKRYRVKWGKMEHLHSTDDYEARNKLNNFIS